MRKPRRIVDLRRARDRRGDLGRRHLRRRRSSRPRRSKPQVASQPPCPREPTAKNPYAPDTVEPGSVEAIAKFTTEPRFGNPWVAYLPDSATVPSPAEYLGHAVGAAGELLEHGPDLRLLPQARRDLAARPRRDDRQERRGARDPPRRHRRRGRHPRPRPPQGSDRRARRPSQDDARGRRSPHRLGAPHLLFQRRAPFDRARQPRDGHGAGLPPGRLRPAHDPQDPRRGPRPHQPRLRARRPRQGGRLVLPLSQGQDRFRQPAARLAAVLGPLRLPRQQPRLAPDGPPERRRPSPGCSSTTTRPSSTTSTNPSRSSRPGTARARSTPTSTRSCSTSGSPCRWPSSAP